MQKPENFNLTRTYLMFGGFKNMNLSPDEPLLSEPSKKLYYYQQQDIDLLLGKLSLHGRGESRLLYQLPTGGGKTVVFSEIARRFIQQFGKKVLVLTHRKELCQQTTLALKACGVANKVIDSRVKLLNRKQHFDCYVAMVETLRHRIEEGIFGTNDIGLVIVDEAHHNSFHKLLGRFARAGVIGVTATPLSASANLPMKTYYQELIHGEPISSLIEQGFLARPKLHGYEVELNTLRTGISGDFNVTSSDELYSSQAMLELLLHAYHSHSEGKKTLIFNNGIFTSKKVLEKLSDEGYPVRHLDNKTPEAERVDILRWFKKTRGAILTSVSILTTGFDEPSIQSVILFRATTSLTLYHQMVGRGARRLNGKKTFAIIDLGNNTERFGNWNDPIDWKDIFENPDNYQQNLKASTSEIHQISPELRGRFPNSLHIAFDVLQAHRSAMENGQKAKTVLRDSIRQHAMMCVDNSESVSQALELSDLLDKEIDFRIKQYSKCLGSVTKDYTKWLGEDYRSRLKALVGKIMGRRCLLLTAS